MAACVAGAMLAALVASCAPLVRVDVRSVSASAGGGEAALGESAAGTPGSSLEDAWRGAEAWPKRWGVPRRDATRYGVIRKAKGPLVPLRSGEDSEKEVEKEMLEDIYTLLGSRRSPSWRDTVTVVGEGKGSFVYQYEKPQEERVDKPPTAAAFFLKFISGTRVSEAAGGSPPAGGQDVRPTSAMVPAEQDVRPTTGTAPGGHEYRVLMQRTWIGYYEPVAPLGAGADAVVPRALAVVVPGIFGTPANVVEQIVSALRSRGYGVVRVLAHPSRFTERAVFDYTGASEADLDAFAARLAAELGDRTAECAYAVEDAITRINTERPETKGLTRIAVGMSGGAMVLPTVVARNPGPYGAAVLIAGGADFCRVAVESNYSPWINAVNVRWKGKALTAEQSARLSAAYLRHAPLDSYYTSAALRDKPVLMLHAQGDEAVPAALGELLWERCGRPDRWVYDAGHEMLFTTLSGRIPEMMEWLEEQGHMAQGHMAK